MASQTPEKMSEDGFVPLPDNPDLSGSCSASGENFKVVVSNKSGYMCHIHLEATFDISPDVIFALFTYPDNSALFRDLKSIGSRKVLSTAPGVKVLEVEQLGELKVLWMTRTYSSILRVTEDSRDPECLIAQFDLERSDMLARFSGRWEIRAVHDPITGKVTTSSTLTQDVLPRGVPPFLQHVPVLGSLLRGVSSRTVSRLMGDINEAVKKVKAGMAKGQNAQQVLKALCGSFDEVGFTNGAVASFAIDDEDSEDDDNDGMAKEEWAQALKLQESGEFPAEVTDFLTSSSQALHSTADAAGPVAVAADGLQSPAVAASQNVAGGSDATAGHNGSVAVGENAETPAVLQHGTGGLVPGSDTSLAPLSISDPVEVAAPVGAADAKPLSRAT